MAKKKDKIIVNKREIDLLNKYYEIDNENRIVTMPLHYEKASDLINNKIISKDNYLFDYEELTSINDMIRRVPIMYKVNIDIQIDDYEDYDPKELLAGFNDQMELNQYNYQRENRLKYLKAGILLIIGVSILFLMGYAKINGFFGDDTRANVYSEIFDIIGWVFIWEMVTVAFLTPSELGVNSNMFKLRVREVSFSDSNKNQLAIESLYEKAKDWDSERRMEKASKHSLLIGGVAFFSIAVIDLIDMVTSFPAFIAVIYAAGDAGVDQAKVIASLIYMTVLSSVVIVLQGFAGYLALRMYYGRKVRVVFPIVFSVILVGLSIANIVISSNEAGTGIVRRIISILIAILYLFGVITYMVLNKKRKKAEEIKASFTENDNKN